MTPLFGHFFHTYSVFVIFVFAVGKFCQVVLSYRTTTPLVSQLHFRLMRMVSRNTIQYELYFSLLSSPLVDYSTSSTIDLSLTNIRSFCWFRFKHSQSDHVFPGQSFQVTRTTTSHSEVQISFAQIIFSHKSFFFYSLLCFSDWDDWSVLSAFESEFILLTFWTWYKHARRLFNWWFGCRFLLSDGK